MVSRVSPRAPRRRRHDPEGRGAARRGGGTLATVDGFFLIGRFWLGALGVVASCNRRARRRRAPAPSAASCSYIAEIGENGGAPRGSSGVLSAPPVTLGEGNASAAVVLTALLEILHAL